VAILLDGEVVAAGTPPELAASRGVEVETDEGTTSYPSASREDVPRIVEELVRDGRSIYSVRTLTSTLEETYLEAVGDKSG
jgi:hypothetical protein